MKFFRKCALAALICMLVCGVCAYAGTIEFIGPDLGWGSESVAQPESSGGDFSEDFGNMDLPQVQEPAEEQAASDGLIPTATLSPEAAALPWNLTLVNRTHPVPDNWQVELKTLDNGRQVDARILEDLQAMMNACRAQGLRPKVNTAYRTYEDQKDMLVKKYRQFRNDGASHESAQKSALKWASYPGYSEHQLGLAVDINTADPETCDNDSIWSWLKRNCQDYGFIWRYPGEKSDITGISNEDWHFRYVGKEAAKYIMENQLTLEEYLQQQYGIQ